MKSFLQYFGVSSPIYQAYFLNWGSKKWSVCSSKALANAPQSDNFPSHFSSVFPSHAAMDYFSILATWLVCETISSQLSTVKPFLGRCLLKYSPESCHWYLQKIFQRCSSILSNSAHRQKAHCSTEPKLLCHWRALKGCPLSLSPTKTFAVTSTGVYLHPGCRECW